MSTNERPIIFSAPMVRAILEGRKTQTRRVMKPQPILAVMEHKAAAALKACRAIGLVPDGKQPHWQWRGTFSMPWPQCIVRRCPYGQIGDRLWVRETWRIGAWDEDEGQFAIDYRDGPDRSWRSDERDDTGEKFNNLWLQCCDELHDKGIHPGKDGRYHWEAGQSPLRWRPSIHMPRWASRITLEITGVRVERLQEIQFNEADALAEGAQRARISENAEFSACEDYKQIWRAINGPESWAANPWVWVVEFNRVVAEARAAA